MPPPQTALSLSKPNHAAQIALTDISPNCLTRLLRTIFLTPPDPLASGLEDPAIVKISAHFTKPATKPSKLPSKSPYNYEPRTVTNSSNQKSTATAVRSTITYGCHTLFFPRILAAWLMSHGSLALNIAFSVLNIVQRPQHHFLAKMWHKNDVFDEKKRILIMYGRDPQ